jgi:competence ComEA-like helix-hairpin-helix protein
LDKTLSLLNWKKTIASYLSFTRKDRIGVLLLITVLALLLFSPKFIPFDQSPRTLFQDSTWIAALRQLEVKEKSESKRFADRDDNEPRASSYTFDRPADNYSRTARRQLFEFDPNSISAADWKRLGLKDRTIQTITNYISKGGRFRKPEDLKRVYGLKTEDFEALEPYITIAPTKTERGNAVQTIFVKKPNNSHAQVKINSADTTAFIALPGIGSKLATRIINFRDKLGGFFSIDQVSETFGLADSTFRKIRQYLELDDQSLKKININTASADELRVHPYIRHNLAKPIVAYRAEHGPFKTLDDLKKIAAITPEILARITPYLTLE